MQAEQWLLLTDYASKYRISVSTLRRRIKGGQIQFRFDGGKYFLLDSPVAPEALAPQRSAATLAYTSAASIPGMLPIAAQEAPLSANAEVKLRELDPRTAEARVACEEPILASATKLLNELKRAYMNVLQEKEEQMIQLKEEVSDLKTLVRVLEDDNERLRRILNGHLAPPRSL
jgi:hypothetical protein